MRRIGISILLSCIALSASAADSSSKKDAFTGDWRVEWCDQDDAKRDCGGFTGSLVQDGDRVSGMAGGATIGLSRLDECSPIAGIVDGDRAYLLIRSTRMGSIFLVDARRVGDGVSWKVRDTLLEGSEGDRDVVARDALLTRAPAGSSMIESCKEPR